AAHHLRARRRHGDRPRLPRRLPRPPRRPGTRPRGPPPGRRLHDRDLPMIPVAHIGGIPLEETLAGAGPALLTALAALAVRIRSATRVSRVNRMGRAWLWRWR